MDAMTEQAVSTFRVGGLLLGIDVSRVAEVVGDASHVPVPRSHPGIAGVMNLRGRVLTVLDVRHRLAVDDIAGAGTPGVHVVVTTDRGAVGLLVDRVLEVLDLSAGAADELPDTIAPRIRAVTRAAFQTPQGLLLVVDPDALLDVHADPRNES